MMRAQKLPRVAFFTDSYYEANGVARTANALEAFAAEGERPMLIVHGGSASQLVESGSIVRLELPRWQTTSFNLDHDLRYDLALWRHLRRVTEVARWFKPDLVHFTGPSDIGQLAAVVGRRLGVPMVGSWHTNVHEYASRRLLNRAGHRLSERSRIAIRYHLERRVLALAALFYTIPRVLLAPNEEWQGILERRTGKRAFVMTRGVDTDLFTPAKRSRPDSAIVNIGYVGRLSTEKNVRALVAVHDALAAAGLHHARFTIVGDGAERDWLRPRLPGAEFTGVLRGRRLAETYANFDLFVFPSETETVGNVVLEAMASGVPVVAMAHGGTRFIAASPASAALARNVDELIAMTLRLVSDRQARRQMGLAARAGALERAWGPVFDTVYQAYDVALAGEPSGERIAGERPFVSVSEKQPAA